LNWRAIRTIDRAQVGAFLALLIVLFLPNYGIEKFGPNPAVPAFLLALMGMWLIGHERLVIFSSTAQRR
jgi:hypothetical protein